MDNNRLKEYNEKRNALIKEYRAKKLKSCLVVVLAAALAVAVDILLAWIIDNVAVGLVIGMMILIFTVIMIRVRIVTANHTLQKRLMYFEQEYE